MLKNIFDNVDMNILSEDSDKILLYTFQQLIVQYSMDAMATFEYTGLPDTIKVEHIEQKGIQLILDSMDELMTYRHVQIFLLGTGKSYYEEGFDFFNHK